jgi:hypothetical protein
MKNSRMTINDSWVLTRTGHFSNSFSSFLSQLSPKMPEKEREKVQKGLQMVPQKLEKATKKLQSLNDPKVPVWIKPFVSKIMQEVAQKVTSELSEVAGELFGAGIFSLSEALYAVAKERGIRHEGMLYLIKMLPEFEALMYFLNVRKFYRDHCAHQLRVTALGDFLLDLKSDAGGIESVIRDKLDLSSREIRTAWWFAGLLHDTGIPLAKLSTAVNWSLLNEILRCYPSLDINASPMLLDLAGADLQNKEYLSILVDGMPRRWQAMLKNGLGVSEPLEDKILFKAGFSTHQEYQPANPSIDHGVVGAVNLLRTLGTPEELRRNLPEDRPLIEAARAISLHNFKEMLRTVPFEEYPLAFLLVLTDELQEWSRPVPVPLKDTYFTTSLEKVALLDAIFYTKPNELWDMPYTNKQAKKLSGFDFKKLCKDKATALSVLDCAEQFPESEIELRNIESDKPKKEESFTIEIKSK